MSVQELIEALESVMRRRETAQPLRVMDLPRNGWRIELTCLGEANWRLTVWELVRQAQAGARCSRVGWTRRSW
ncbi:MAG TPA: hypothetical protein VFG99_00490, partial [Chloroflexia bacterium]|nr:hypothetical protein [Chloroflexia bacterium]